MAFKIKVSTQSSMRLDVNSLHAYYYYKLR